MTKFSNNAGLQAAVYDLLSDAVHQDIERRSHQREPYFSAIAIQPKKHDGCWLTGFSRDVSAEGIGLMHSFPLEREEVVVKLSCANRDAVQLRVKIEWCDALGEGWYISGGRFVGRVD